MPPKRKYDNHFGNRYLLRNISKMVPMLIGFSFLWAGWSNGLNFATWAGIASFVFGIVMWARDDRRLLKNYRCPDCGEHLPKATIEHPSEGEPIIYYCPACDTEWDTRLRA